MQIALMGKLPDHVSNRLVWINLETAEVPFSEMPLREATLDDLHMWVKDYSSIRMCILKHTRTLWVIT